MRHLYVASLPSLRHYVGAVDSPVYPIADCVIERVFMKQLCGAF